MIEFFFKEPLAGSAAIVAVICLILRIYIGRKQMDPLKPKQSEPEWAEKLNKNMGDKQQRKEIFWRNAVIFFVLLGIVLHFFGK
ncbi:TPA: hypothetical protein JZE49_003668 [Escherichia coli]|nr:hypothetical protein [Escherichia coli]